MAIPSPSGPAPKPRRTDRLFLWLFGGALLLLALYRFWPDSQPGPEPVVVEQEAPPQTPEQWEASTPPSSQQQWEQTDAAAAPAGQSTSEEIRLEQAPDLAGLDESAPAASSEPDDKVYTYVEQMPQPPGGMEGLLAYLQKNIKYPAEALRNQVEGKVFVNFIVRRDGRITDAQVVKGIGAGCDEEALRVIQQMPHWQPGKQNGRAVSVTYTVPISFTIK